MSKTNILKVVVLTVILGGAAYVAVRQHQARPLAIGARAPDFTLPALPSGSLNLDSYRQQVVVVHFWATWCPPCVEETPSLERFWERMQPQGVAVIGVSVDDDRQAVQEFLGQYHVTYRVGLDPDRALAARFGTFQFPETYILDRYGRVARKLVGEVDWDDPRIESSVLELVHGSGR